MKVLHLDSNHPLLINQFAYLVFTNHEELLERFEKEDYIIF